MVGGMGCTSQESSSIAEVAWVTMVGSSVVAGGMGLLVRGLLATGPADDGAGLLMPATAMGDTGFRPGAAGDGVCR